MATRLAKAPPLEQKQMLGERLFPLIQVVAVVVLMMILRMLILAL